MEKFDNNSRCLYPGIDVGIFKTSVCTSNDKKSSGRTAIAFLQKGRGGPEESMLSGQEAVALKDGTINESLKNELGFGSNMPLEFWQEQCAGKQDKELIL